MEGHNVLSQGTHLDLNKAEEVVEIGFLLFRPVRSACFVQIPVRFVLFLGLSVRKFMLHAHGWVQGGKVERPPPRPVAFTAAVEHLRASTQVTVSYELVVLHAELVEGLLARLRPIVSKIPLPTSPASDVVEFVAASFACPMR